MLPSYRHSLLPFLKILGDLKPMPALLPIVAIFAVFIFISTHAAVTPSTKKKIKEPSDLEKAAKEIAKALSNSDKTKK